MTSIVNSFYGIEMVVGFRDREPSGPGVTYVPGMNSVRATAR